MAGAQAHIVSPLQQQRSSAAAAAAGNVAAAAARRSQFGGGNMLAGFSNNNNPLLNGVSNPGLTGIPQSLTGTTATSLITGSNSDFPDLQPLKNNLQQPVVVTESLALSGLAGMGLPTSPVSISSTIVNSMVSQQGNNSSLSRLEQQQDLLLQQQQQQVRSATPPLSATAQLSQLSQLTQQPMHQERAAGQQSSGGGSQQQQQAMLLANGLQRGNNNKASGSSPQQQQVKVEPMSSHSLQQQQQMLIPKMEVKSEVDLDQKVSQQHPLRSANNLGLTPEMQLQEAILQRQQQSKHMQAQFSALQQQRLLQGLPPLQQQQHLHDTTTSLQLQQQLQHQQRLQPQQANFLQSAGVRKHPDFEAGGCARKLMQYLYHQRHRPPDNNIAFWRNFVAQYFAPNAKKRWCVSLYVSGGRQPTGIFPQDVWHCEICGTNPGRGFETTVEVLPRLFKIKFDSGIQEELLFVDLPHEYRQASGHMVLEYGKAIQESVFEQLRVVREGQLRIVFSSDLKILSWEFCARSHEELLLRRLIVPQVNQLVQISQKYQNSQNGGAGVSAQDLQTNCHLFVTSARQLAKNLELPTVNDLGYTKRYVRCLQISEVVNSMKDLIDFSRDNSVGPVDSLHKFPRRSDGSSRTMLRNAQIRALQEQQERQQQQEQQQRQQQQQQQQQEQQQRQQQQQQEQQQQQQQQQEELDLHSLLADTNTTALSGLQQPFNEANQNVDGLDEAISAPTETDPLSFFHSNSLAALQTSLHDTLQSPAAAAAATAAGNNVQNINNNTQQQLSSGGGGRVVSGSSPTNSLSSFQNSFPSISGGGVVVAAQQQSSSHPYLRGESSQSQQAHHHPQANNSNVHHLLQEMMVNQQGGSSNGGQQARMLGLGSSNGNNNHHLGVINNSIGSLVGAGGVSSTLRGGPGGMAGGNLSGLMGNMNAHHRLAAAVAQQQQQNQLQHIDHPSLHHDLAGGSMLGGLGITGSFGGLFN